MAVTLGTRSEMLLRREYALSPTDGLIADACASSMVEQAADALNGIIDEQATAHDAVATWRFSPGYGDLPLSCQRDVLRLSGADKALGLRVNEADLLVPAKSIAAVIGLARNGETLGSRAGSRMDAARKNAAGAAVGPGNAVGMQDRTGLCDSEGSGEDGCADARRSPAGTAAVPSGVSVYCEFCTLAPTCSLRAKGRTCHGNEA